MCPYRLLEYQIVPTKTHPSTKVRAAGHRSLSAIYKAIFWKSVTERRAAANEQLDLPQERDEKVEKAEEIERVLDDFEGVEQAEAFQWQWSLTWVVAQKAFFVNEGEDWLNARKERS